MRGEEKKRDRGSYSVITVEKRCHWQWCKVCKIQNSVQCVGKWGGRSIESSNLESMIVEVTATSLFQREFPVNLSLWQKEETLRTRCNAERNRATISSMNLMLFIRDSLPSTIAYLMMGPIHEPLVQTVLFLSGTEEWELNYISCPQNFRYSWNKKCNRIHVQNVSESGESICLKAIRTNFKFNMRQAFNKIK